MNAPTKPDDRRPNHLAGQTSPYLLQHLYNPVDWHAWGSEALAVHCDEERFRLAADRTLKAYRPVTSHVPSAYVALLVAADLARGPLHGVAIVGSPDDRATRELLAVARQRYVHRPIVQAGMPRAVDSPLPLLAGKQAIDGKPTAYVCRNYACQRPTTDPRELGRQLGA